MDPRAERVRGMFSAIAGRYDLLNRVLSFGMDRGWRMKAVRDLPLPADPRFLDACGGTGDLAAAFLRRHPGGSAVVLDFSEPMLRIAHSRRSEWKNRATPVLGDALRLPFPSGSFDALGCAFGVRNLADLDGGLKEFLRVLRPGGALAILEFTPGGEGVLGPCVAWYVRRVVPRIGRLLSSRPSAYGYLSDSVAAFLTGDELVEAIRGAGFVNVSRRPFSFGACTLFTALRPDRN